MAPARSTCHGEAEEYRNRSQHRDRERRAQNQRERHQRHNQSGEKLERGLSPLRSPRRHEYGMSLEEGVHKRQSHRFSSERRSAWKSVEATKAELSYLTNTRDFPPLSASDFRYTPEGPKAVSRTRVKEATENWDIQSTDWGSMVEEHEAQNQIAKRKLVLADKTERDNQQDSKTKRPAETDQAVLGRRQKQIDYGKNTASYWNYVKQIARSKRSKHHPRTPSKYQVCSRRSFDAQIKTWKKQLHVWGNNTDTSSTGSVVDAGAGRRDLLYSDTSSDCTESVGTEARMDVDEAEISASDGYPTPPNSQEDAHPLGTTNCDSVDPNRNLPPQWSEPNSVMDTLMAACQVTNRSAVYDYNHGMDNFPAPTCLGEPVPDNRAKNFMDEFNLDDCLRQEEDADNFNL